MTAVRVRGDFSQAWEVANGRARRRDAEQRATALRDRYPRGRVEGVEPWSSALDGLLALTGVTVRDWRSDGRGFAYLASADRGVSIPPPVDAETAALGVHEAMHFVLDRHAEDRADATSFRSEIETWRATLGWWRRERLPGREEVERLAAGCLRGRPEVKRFGRQALRQALNEPVGAPLRETPAATVRLIRGYG